MKKLLILLVTMSFVVSCGDEIKFNTPALQGKKDNADWRAEYYEAAITDGQLVITGGRGSETIVLNIASNSVGTYILGEESTSSAEFNNTQDVTFSTNNEPDPIIQIYPADGEIEIEEYSASGNLVTGRFWFNAFSGSGLQKVNFSQGVFYQIPVSGGGSTIVSCDDAVAVTQSALTVYDATDNLSSDFPPACEAYKVALMQQIISCGDDTNVLQDLINGLDCVLPCDAATTNASDAQAIYDATDESSDMFSEVCIDYQTALEQQLDSCGDASGDLQLIIDGLECETTVVVPGDCETCTGGLIPDATYCDNGDGTISITISGVTNTVDLNGFTFESYIQTLESSGATCE